MTTVLELSLLAPAASEATGGFGFGFALLKMLVALAVVCALAYLLLRFGLRRLVQGSAVGKHMRIVEHCALGPGKGLWLVQVGGRALLVAGAERAVTLLAELDPAELDGSDTERAAADAGAFASHLAGGRPRGRPDAESGVETAADSSVQEGGR